MDLPSISLNRMPVSDFQHAIQKEWIITNGLGGFASSTVLGINTRKYHGLLVAAIHPPKDRRVFLSKLDEDIVATNDVYRLGATEFEDVIFPKGYESLETFTISPFPKYVYKAYNIIVQKTIFMPHEDNCVVIVYNISNENGSETAIRLFPSVNWRHVHDVTTRSKASEIHEEQTRASVKIDFQEPNSTLLLKGIDCGYRAKGNWIERIYLREEASRCETCYDDCYQPGYFETVLKAGETKDLAIIALADEDRSVAVEMMNKLPSTSSGLKTMLRKEASSYADFLKGFYDSHETVRPSDWLSWLVLASGSFIVKGIHKCEQSILAGYHWFESWGRDTFVSLPGLLLVPGRFEEAREVFLSFKRHCSRGLIPNFLPDKNGPAAYNTVDATLWYVNAVWQYLKYTGDFNFVKQQLWETLKTILESHMKGTLFNIHVDSDCLLSHGPQLTWMDASINGDPVTPREGKAVEIQALWYNTLRVMELLARTFGETKEADKYVETAGRTKHSFSTFWDTRHDCLSDVMLGRTPDDSMRPNQIIAVAIDFTMLDRSKNECIVDIVEQELLTPFGLRSLSMHDPRYVGVYCGARTSRDLAYHNGTVWPWLLGPLATASLKTKKNVESQRQRAFQKLLEPLFTQQVYQAGLGSLSEIFDGDTPHLPRGCIAQAWSIAEPFRAYFEDILQVRPRYEEAILHP